MRRDKRREARRGVRRQEQPGVRRADTVHASGECGLATPAAAGATHRADTGCRALVAKPCEAHKWRQEAPARGQSARVDAQKSMQVSAGGVLPIRAGWETAAPSARKLEACGDGRRGGARACEREALAAERRRRVPPGVQPSARRGLAPEALPLRGEARLQRGGVRLAGRGAPQPATRPRAACACAVAAAMDSIGAMACADLLASLGAMAWHGLRRPLDCAGACPPPVPSTTTTPCASRMTCAERMPGVDFHVNCRLHAQARGPAPSPPPTSCASRMISAEPMFAADAMSAADATSARPCRARGAACARRGPPPTRRHYPAQARRAPNAPPAPCRRHGCRHGRHRRHGLRRLAATSWLPWTPWHAPAPRPGTTTGLRQAQARRRFHVVHAQAG